MAEEYMRNPGPTPSLWARVRTFFRRLLRRPSARPNTGFDMFQTTILTQPEREAWEKRQYRVEETINRNEAWRRTDDPQTPEAMKALVKEAAAFDYRKHVVQPPTAPPHPDPLWENSPSRKQAVPKVRPDSEFIVPRVKSDE
jgi:hypothetical protein